MRLCSFCSVSLSAYFLQRMGHKMDISQDDTETSARDRKVSNRRDRKEMNKPFKRGGGKDKQRDSQKFRKEYEEFMDVFNKEDDDDE